MNYQYHSGRIYLNYLNKWYEEKERKIEDRIGRNIHLDYCNKKIEIIERDPEKLRSIIDYIEITGDSKSELGYYRKLYEFSLA